MGRIARVEKVSVVDSVRIVTVDDGSGSPDDVDLYLPPGVDALPMVGDLVTLVDAVGNDGPVTVTALDDTTPDGEGGWYRLYSRNAAGAVMAWVRLEGDGKIEIANENGKIEMLADGTVDVNNGNLEVLP